MNNKSKNFSKNSVASDTVPAETKVDEAVFEAVVKLRRCALVVKGGRRFSFAAVSVFGDQKGNLGIGYGKAKEVPDAIRKSGEKARKNTIRVCLRGTTIPHEVIGCSDGGKVLLRPARPGTGIIAGGAVRLLLEAVGIKNVLTKSLGSNNALALVNATLDALKRLRSQEDFEQLRGKKIRYY